MSSYRFEMFKEREQFRSKKANFRPDGVVCTIGKTDAESSITSILFIYLFFLSYFIVAGFQLEIDTFPQLRSRILQAKFDN